LVPVGILGATVAAFFLHELLHLEPATIALTGAAALLLTGISEVDETLALIDWPTLFFFAGLFVMVGGLEEVGVIDAIAERTADITAGDRQAEFIGIMGSRPWAARSSTTSPSPPR
jgi:Na+/H+ antiporter NhaD/arsenite permease-like protein